MYLFAAYGESSQSQEVISLIHWLKGLEIIVPNVAISAEILSRRNACFLMRFRLRGEFSSHFVETMKNWTISSCVLIQ